MNKLTILMFSLTFMTLFAEAGESFIPLQKGLRVASDDLIYNNTLLSSREAQDLSNFKNIDLSLLQPSANDIWSPLKMRLDDSLAIDLGENETLTFEGSLSSNSGLYRFNAIPENSSRIFTLHLDKTLHTLLLRKNILRLLGYKIPAIKYLKKALIKFDSIEARDQFLKKDIPENTLGASERWAKIKTNLTVEVKDLAVTESSENDFYNVAFGVPTQTINSRSLRSLLIPYSLLDLYESVNQYSWVNGKIDNNAIILSHFTGNDFATTLEDAQWMVRRVNLLTREEIKQAVDLAYFPNDVAAVLVEKIVSRRNSLNKLFSEKFKEMSFDKNINIGDSVKKGKILKKDYLEFASRFAYDDAQTPFDQIRYYLYTKLQSKVIDNLISKFNSYLDGKNQVKDRARYFKGQFEKGLQHFIKTGELTPIGVGVWVSPVYNADLIFSRDIVIGNSLGTDNLVQLADTFGGSVNVGVHVGVEGLGTGLAGSVRATMSIVRTFSHIKPVKNLKESLKEPYKNMFVSLLKGSLKERYFALSELKNSTVSDTEKAKKVQTLLKEINMYLDTGESLIVTDRFMPSANVRLGFTSGMLSAGVGVGGDIVTTKRIHIYKKSANILQIYDDSGFVSDINLSFTVSEYIPILRVSGKFDRGHYEFKSYMVNLSSDLEENPNFYSNALGVYNVFKNKNFELLKAQAAPVSLDARFKDNTFNFSLLFWKMKSIKGKTYYDLKAKDGINGRYFSLKKDFMNGINIESFAKQVASYFINDLTDGNASLSEAGDSRPGDSFFGRSETQRIRFEAAINTENKFENKFLTLSDVKQGWAIGPKRLKKMMEKVNEKFETMLFDTTKIDFEQLKLFKVGYHVNLYDRGLERLNNLKSAEIFTIEARYRKEKGCSRNHRDYFSPVCGDLRILRWDILACEKSKTEEEVASCNIELLDDLLTFLKFNDFKQLIGLDNFYVYGTMDGFRKKSEILNDTIFSNTVGQIGSKYWDGPLNVVRELLGLSDGEFSGVWLRESL
jgi:hypothetical protein